MVILITGSAGYIGTLLIKRLFAEKAVRKIVGVDLLARPKDFSNQKLIWLQHDLAKDGWQEKAAQEGPFDALIHLAFKIRSPYGAEEKTKENNLGASRNVFKFAFENKIPKLIYSSSVAAYGARKENVGKLLGESDRLKEDKSPYGCHKRLVEEMLQVLAATMKPKTNTIIVRLNSVTGPYGQSLKSKFGLITFLKKLLPFVIEANPAWARQFIHEKDVEEIFWRLLNMDAKPGRVETYNAAPPSYLTAQNIAKLLDKKVLRIPSRLIKPAFFIVWHLTLGKIPTHPDSADGLIYPINVDGSKLEEVGFHYRFSPADALLGKP